MKNMNIERRTSNFECEEKMGLRVTGYELRVNVINLSVYMQPN